MRPRPERFFFPILILCLGLLCSTAWTAEFAPVLRVTFINVGQGDAILLRTSEKTILLDGGDDRFFAGRDIILPYLKNQGIDRLDTVVISHPHRDHYGGLLDVVENIPIGEVLYANDTNVDSEVPAVRRSSETILYRKLRQLILSRNIPYVRAQANMDFNWGQGINVELLHEADQKFAPDDPLKYNANEDSLVFKITVGKISYLLSGDAESGTESKLIQKYGKKLKSSVLKFGHHGSKTSSTQPFLELVQPDYGVISVGSANSFGHPNQESLDKAAFYRMKVFRTDVDGTVESSTDGQSVQFETQQSALAFTKKPTITALTNTSVTLQWTTNKRANSQIQITVAGKSRARRSDQAGKVHTLTITGLHPGTEYAFRALSQDERQLQQVIDFEGSFTTKTAHEAPVAQITAITTDQKNIFLRRPFRAIVTIANPSAEPAGDLTGRFYRSGIDDRNLIGELPLSDIPGKTSINKAFPMEFAQQTEVTLIFALLQNGVLIDTETLVLTIKPKVILVDCAHGNTEYSLGAFAGMKMDLFSSCGFTVQPIPKTFSEKTFGDAFTVIISNPVTPYSQQEIKTLQSFISSGGSLMLFGQSDFQNLSNPQVLNEVLEGIGSTIRFNDDQFVDPTDNAGAPWRAILTKFPAAGIISDIDRLMLRSACSLIDSKRSGLKAGKNVHLLATGDDDSQNIDLDGLNDGFIYASHTPDLPIPVIAAEDLGTGRVACYGEKLYESRYYSPSSTMPTREFNQQVVAWLGETKSKTLPCLLAYAQDIATLEDQEMAMIRCDFIRDAFQQEARQVAAENPDQLPDLRALCDEFSGSLVDEFRVEITELHRFHQLHGSCQ